MKDYEPRLCIICGVEYIPKRSDQRTCGSEECLKERQKLNYREYRKTHYAALLETNRRSMAKKRKEREMEKHPPKHNRKAMMLMALRILCPKQKRG